jgi:hypothetical protein
MTTRDWFNDLEPIPQSDLPDGYNCIPCEWTDTYPQLYRLIAGNRVGDDPRETGRIAIYTKPNQVLCVLADAHLKRVGFVSSFSVSAVLREADEKLKLGQVHWKEDTFEVRKIRGRGLRVD